MNELDKRSHALAVRIVITIVVVALLVVVGLAKAQAEPFPEWLKTHKQAYVCYTSVMKDGTMRKTDEWVVNWSMVTDWVPYEYIKFQGRREAVIPTPKDYTCDVWTTPKPKKKTK